MGLEMIKLKDLLSEKKSKHGKLVATAGICVCDNERPDHLVSASFNISFNLIISNPIPS